MSPSAPRPLLPARPALLALLAACLLLPGAARGAEAPKIVVLDFQVSGGLDRALGTALSEAATESVSRGAFYTPVSSAELQSVMAVERQRQLAGCSESECLTEIAGALGAPFVMTGSVARFGEAFQLTVQVLNAKNAQPVGRSVRLARELAVLRTLVPYAVSEATGAPPPPPPSRLLPYALMATGGGVTLLGGVVGLKALSDQAELTADLRRASDLEALPVYEDRARLVATEKTLSLVGMGAGVALLAAGFLLNPPDLATGGVALVPARGGLGLAGTFP
jgi:TolB-like protein